LSHQRAIPTIARLHLSFRHDVLQIIPTAEPDGAIEDDAQAGLGLRRASAGIDAVRARDIDRSRREPERAELREIDVGPDAPGFLRRPEASRPADGCVR